MIRADPDPRRLLAVAEAVARVLVAERPPCFAGRDCLASAAALTRALHLAGIAEARTVAGLAAWRIGPARADVASHRWHCWTVAGPFIADATLWGLRARRPAAAWPPPSMLALVAHWRDVLPIMESVARRAFKPGATAYEPSADMLARLASPDPAEADRLARLALDLAG